LNREHRQAIKKLGLSDDSRLACRSSVTSDLSLEIDQFDTFILADSTTFHFTPAEGYGVAIDLGTTTLVAQLLDLSNGHVLDAVTGLNPQAEFGADVISRIEYAIRNEGLPVLQKLIRKTLAAMVNKLILRHKVEVTKVVIVGNTVMQHIFSGLDLTPLSAYPFESKKKEFYSFSPEKLKFKTENKAELMFLPSLGSFVGSDILAGILATRIHKSEKYIALIDLGTNGEIVVGNKDKILCASTAAGPAFEGTNIRMGMRASTGAISSISEKEGEIKYHIIGNEEPRGICGSGLIDAIAVFIKDRKIDAGGRILNDKDSIELAPPVIITQKDIRELQLAKGAIAAGLQILLDQLKITHNQVESVYIAGAFGNFINIENTRRIGLIEFQADKIHKMGNTALIGAKMSLFLNKTEIEPILALTEHVSLEMIPDFQDLFADKMMFE
jgi:uncharacterized 2Fe-2S/4Fe-4S cluster protein (DUF4445 family)